MAGSDLLTLFAVWLFSRCKGGEGGELAPVPSVPGGQPGWPGSPVVLPTSTPEWPQQVPTDLPPFPGPGWEFDEPPPAVVKQRAGQLVDELWRRGSGAFRVERTAARWIAYQAQVVASGRKGVVAYRIKRAAAQPAAPAMTASRAVPRAAPRPAARPAPRARVLRPAQPPAAPARPSPAPPAATQPRVSVPPSSSAMNLPTLRLGAGAVPGPPSNDVRLLQQRLGIAADGRFGAGTETAVREFQRRNGLTVDGIVGQQTWTKLFNVRV